MRVLETKHKHLALLATVLDNAMQCTNRCIANGKIPSRNTSLRQAQLGKTQKGFLVWRLSGIEAGRHPKGYDSSWRSVFDELPERRCHHCHIGLVDQAVRQQLSCNALERKIIARSLFKGYIKSEL